MRRNDGAPAYNLAVVVDDTAQGVGEVVRGADLIETTARQLHARSVGLAAAGEAPSLDELLTRFDAARIPTEPTVLAA